jgi:hypothetical protein
MIEHSISFSGSKLRHGCSNELSPARPWAYRAVGDRGCS